MPRDDAPTPAQVCSGIRIHAIDIVQPPGIGIPPIADMDVHQAIINVVLTANSSEETATIACSAFGSEARCRHVHSPAVIIGLPFRLSRRDAARS
jgi:hypothetical protein